MDEILFTVEDNMETCLEYLRKELRGIRTGRASAGLVDHIKVEYFGSPTEMRQLATISTPEANMIIIKPFDPSSLKDIERAIQASDLGITPSSEGKVIPVSYTHLTLPTKRIV